MFKQFISWLSRKTGVKVERLNKVHIPHDFEDDHKSILKKISSITMTSPERIFSLVEAVKYVCRHQIEGAIVECGVWKGGSMLACAETLVSLNDISRDLFLYDTYEGMPPPTEKDKNLHNIMAEKLLNKNLDKNTNEIWAYSTLEEVKKNLSLSAYPSAKCQFIKGKIEDTIPMHMPDKIAILRLDTDWYESTRHELIHLYPRLVNGGVLIIDDYGYWKGARQAVDEYFEQNKIPVFLLRIDETARLTIKSSVSFKI